VNAVAARTPAESQKRPFGARFRGVGGFGLPYRFGKQ
jgi:hypothetical protein